MGARVTLVDNVAQWADETKRLIDAEAGVSQIVEGDVSALASCQAIVARTIEAWGRLDILVNNVGITGPRGNAVEVDVEAWDSAMRVQRRLHDADGEIRDSRNDQERRRLDHQSQLGRGLSGGHPSLLYPTSKGAIVSLTRAMAAHHGRDGIRVNCIAPGTVYTPMVASRGMTPEMRKARSEGTLLGTEGTGWDIGYGALFFWPATNRAGSPASRCRSMAARRRAARDRRCRQANRRHPESLANGSSECAPDDRAPRCVSKAGRMLGLMVRDAQDALLTMRVNISVPPPDSLSAGVLILRSVAKRCVSKDGRDAGLLARSRTMRCHRFYFKQLAVCRHGLAISPHTLREVCQERPVLLLQRAQGMPGARCTRSLVCDKKQTHERSHQRSHRKSPGIPRAMVLRLTSRSPR